MRCLCCCDGCSSPSCVASQAASPWAPPLTAVPPTAGGGRPGQGFQTVLREACVTPGRRLRLVCGRLYPLEEGAQAGAGGSSRFRRQG